MKLKYFNINYCTSEEINDFSRKLMALKEVELLVASDYDEEEYFQFSNGVIQVLDKKTNTLKSLMDCTYLYLYPYYKNNSLLKIFLQTVKSELLREKNRVHKALDKVEQLEFDLNSNSRTR